MSSTFPHATFGAPVNAGKLSFSNIIERITREAGASVHSDHLSDPSSDESWREWTTQKHENSKPARSASVDSSDSSDLSLGFAEEPEERDTSADGLQKWLQTKVFTIRLDPRVCNRTWKVKKLHMRRINVLKSDVKNFLYGLEYVTGIPQHLTFLVCGEEGVVRNEFWLLKPFVLDYRVGRSNLDTF